MLTDDLGIDNSLLDENPTPQSTSTSINSKRNLLEELRLKQNACRKRNHQQVVEEDKRVNSPAVRNSRGSDVPARTRESNTTQDNEEEEDNYLLSTTAEQAIAVEKRKHKKKKGTFGWEMFNEEAHHNSYKRRAKDLPDYRQAPPPSSLSSSSSSSSTLLDGTGQVISVHPDESLYGIQHKPEKEALDRMVNELQKAEDRRNKFSRRREANPSTDITYINERNKLFNKKIARAFDQYTVEIRQNLERGTAL